MSDTLEIEALVLKAFEATSDPVIITDAGLLGAVGPKIVFVNQALTALTGYKREELIGQSPSVFQGHGSDPATIARLRDSIDRGKETKEVILNYTKTGTPYWNELSISPISASSGKIQAFVSIQRDVSDSWGQSLDATPEDARMLSAASEKIAGVASWAFLVDEKRMAFSEGMFDIFGWDKSSEPQEEESLAYFDHDDRRKFLTHVERCIKGDVAFETEVKIRRRDGAARTLRINGEALRERNDRTKAVVGAVRDISTETTMRSELSRAIMRQGTLERDFALARSIAKIGKFSYSIKNDVIVGTDELYAMTGLAKGQFPAPASLFLSRIDERDRPRLEELLADAIRLSRRFSTRLRFIRSDGTVVHSQIYADVIDDEDDERRLVGIARDVTEEITASEMLLFEQERFRLIADAVSDVLWDFDVDEGTSWAAPGWQERLGVDFEDKDLTFDQWTSHIASEDRGRVFASWREALSSGADKWTEETAIVDRADARLHVQINARFMRSKNGRVYRALGNIRNIEREKEVNDILARTRGLEVTSRMTGGIAHDFNNLLMIMLGSLESLGPVRLSSEEREALEAIERSVDSATDLTMRLLDFSGSSAAQVSNFKPGALLNELAPLIRSSLTNRIALTLDAGENVWPIQADKSSFERAVLNFAVNARDAITGSGNLLIHCKDLEIDVLHERGVRELPSGRYVCISFKDDGQGMDAETLEKAREPYFTTKGVGEGTGLGLSSSYGFARQCGGTVLIESAVGSGTTVSMFLPAADLVREPNKIDVPVHGGRKPTAKRILLVEDGPLIRNRLNKLLSEMGYSVTCVENATLALKALQGAHPFDLLFTDIVMPGGISGLDLAVSARAQSQDIGVILTSGFMGDIEIPCEFVGEAPRFLQKPYRATKLAELLNEIFSEEEALVAPPGVIK